MTADTTIISEMSDPFDADLRELFAGVHPAAGFEDRLIHAVRQRDRFAIPMAVKRAAIAAAAVLAVGTAGYYGNQAITGNLQWGRRYAVERYAPTQNSANAERDVSISGAIDRYADKAANQWDFGGGSSSTQNWTDWNGAGGITKSSAYRYENPFSGTTAIANGWQQKNPGATYAISRDMNPTTPALAAPVAMASPARESRSSPYDHLDSVLLPNAHANGEEQEKSKADVLLRNLDETRNATNDLGVARSKLNAAAPALVGHFGSMGSPPSPTVAVIPPDSAGYKPTVRNYVVGTSAVANNASGQNYFHGSSNGQIASAAGLDQTGQNLCFKPSQLADDSKSPRSGFGPSDNEVSDSLKSHAPKESRYGQDKNSTLAGLVQDARQFTDEGKYAEALKVTENIQKLDLTNAYANGVTQFLTDRARNQEQRKYREDFDTEFNKNLKADGDFASTGGAIHDLMPNAPAAVIGAPQPAQAPPTPPPVAAPAPVVDDRKIIRTGTMEFDVDRFDTAQMQINKIVGELGGFVGATDSTKLPNGKVRGSISVRVPPERLDTLVLSLRALGDLKSQQITAADITKEYTDIQSELTADRAMQDRLLELIHDGKGSVKDLLAAENELGEWRTKIEKAEGMIRYYNGQVALSTLSITLTERDIHTPAAAVETETADVGIEAENVEKARADAMKAIEDVKGRIVEAELKRFDAGQLAAKLVADVPPESAGAVIDQLKLLGKVARLEVHRQQQNTDGTAAVTNTIPLRTERKPTRLLISIYNLANVAPRRTTVVNLAAKDVESAYAALVNAVKSDGGRVVTSNLDRGDPVKATGSLVLELPPEKFDSAMTTLHAQGDVLNLNLTENPDTQNSTEAKQGLTVKLISLANVAPRRTTNTSLAANDVDAAYAALISVAKNNGGRVVSSTLDRGEPGKTSGSLILEIPPEKLEATLSTLHAQGDVLNLNQTENSDTQNSTESKQGLTVKLFSQAAVKARESIDQTIASIDVPMSYQAILSAANSVHARIEQAALNEQDRQNISADIELEVPRTSVVELDKAIASAGGTLARTSSRAPDTETAVDSKLHLKLTIGSADRLPPRETTRLQVEVNDVDKSTANAQAAALAAGGRVLEASVRKDSGQSVGRIILDFPLNKSGELLSQVRSQGTVRNIDSSRDQQAPAGPMAHAQIVVEFRTGDAIVADQTGPWASIREGLSTSINGLLWSLRWVVVGLCLIGPWALIGWVAWKMRGRWVRSKSGVGVRG